VCANYHPVTSQDRLLEWFGVGRPIGTVPPDLYPVQLAPFIVRHADKVEIERQVELGLFGLVPHWAKDIAFGRRTYNARSETADKLPSFRDSWRRGRRCIIPAEAIYEPSYETGKAVRWRISLADGRPMGIAGLWGWWRAPDGKDVLSFTMLTVNADDHALMKRFHKPGDEKRMVVILDPAEYDAWLDAPLDRVRSFLRQYPAELMVSEPAPRR
jgi:putative SOS response-associated peptidase YedK